MKVDFLAEAAASQDTLISLRRQLHRTAGAGFDIPETLSIVQKELEKLGLAFQNCGKAGLVATITGKKPGKVFLLRADMDALPIREESGEDFASDNGCMHACGHDMHTAMLLTAAKLLKEHEDTLCGTIKLMFQPAEELLEGAKNMVESGVLNDPRPDAAMMVHVMTGTPFMPGTVVVSGPGESAPAADYFTINVQGVGCHGSSPNTGVDPLSAAAHIVTALQEISARELSMNDRAVLTLGTFHAGTTANVIPDTATLTGTLRAFDENLRAQLKERISVVSKGIAAAFRATAEVTFDSGCPALLNNKALSDDAARYMKELLGENMAFSVPELEQKFGSTGSKTTGSEDFAYVSRKVPSIMAALAAGHPKDGYTYPLHHPQVRFDETALPFGAAAYAAMAYNWLLNHTD